MAKKKVQNDDGAIPAQPGPVSSPTEKPGTYVVNFRHVSDKGTPGPHSWLPYTLQVPGCKSEEEARQKVRDIFNASIFHVERVRGS